MADYSRMSLPRYLKCPLPAKTSRFPFLRHGMRRPQWFIAWLQGSLKFVETEGEANHLLEHVASTETCASAVQIKGYYPPRVLLLPVYRPLHKPRAVV